MLSSLTLSNFRNIKQADLPCSGKWVLLVGDNAAGKTSLLEAVSLLLGGRSFRTRQSHQLIQDGSSILRVIGKWSDGRVVGAERSVNSPPVHRFNQAAIPLSTLVSQFPLQVFDSRLFDLFEGAASDRRSILDWGLFHVEQDFFLVWREYQYALKNRNAILKSIRNREEAARELVFWNQELAAKGQSIDAMRKKYALNLIERSRNNALMSELSLEFEYDEGWPNSESLQDYLDRTLDRDFKQGRTGGGPHLADLKLRVENKKAGQRLSRGQKKIGACAIKIEQMRLYNAYRNQMTGSEKGCLALVDDLASELDKAHQAAVINQLAEVASQVFLTSIDEQPLLSILKNQAAESISMFHVKQGQLIPYPAQPV